MSEAPWLHILGFSIHSSSWVIPHNSTACFMQLCTPHSHGEKDAMQ